MMSEDTTIDLKALLPNLPKGWVDTIRDRLDRKYSTGYIRMVVADGTKWNKEIAKAAVTLAEENVQEMARIKQRIDGISNTAHA